MEKKEKKTENKKQRGPDKKPRKRGREHKNFKYGARTRNYNPLRYNAWKEGVLRRDNFSCFVTGEIEKKLLTCHHLNSWDVHIDERYEISNGITITKAIHRAFHKEYGAGNNTKEQFEEFLQKNYNIFEYTWQNDNHEPILSVDEIEARRASQQDRQKQLFLKLLKERGHQLHSSPEGFYAHSKVEIWCPRHCTISTTKVTNYKKCKTGLLCCGRQVQSDK